MLDKITDLLPQEQSSVLLSYLLSLLTPCCRFILHVLFKLRSKQIAADVHHFPLSLLCDEVSIVAVARWTCQQLHRLIKVGKDFQGPQIQSQPPPWPLTTSPLLWNSGVLPGTVTPPLPEQSVLLSCKRHISHYPI